MRRWQLDWMTPRQEPSKRQNTENQQHANKAREKWRPLHKRVAETTTNDDVATPPPRLRGPNDACAPPP